MPRAEVNGIKPELRGGRRWSAAGVASRLADRPCGLAVAGAGLFAVLPHHRCRHAGLRSVGQTDRAEYPGHHGQRYRWAARRARIETAAVAASRSGERSPPRSRSTTPIGSPPRSGSAPTATPTPSSSRSATRPWSSRMPICGSSNLRAIPGFWEKVWKANIGLLFNDEFVQSRLGSYLITLDLRGALRPLQRRSHRHHQHPA